MWESTTTIDSPHVWPEETWNNRFNGEPFNGWGSNIFHGFDTS